MKNFNELTKEELWKLRNEIVLCSIFLADYKNSFGFKPIYLSQFFDGYEEYLCELIKEDGLSYSYEELIKRDTPENLYDWRNCSDDWSWIKLEEE